MTAVLDNLHLHPTQNLQTSTSPARRYNLMMIALQRERSQGSAKLTDKALVKSIASHTVRCMMIREECRSVGFSQTLKGESPRQGYEITDTPKQGTTSTSALPAKRAATTRG